MNISNTSVKKTAVFSLKDKYTSGVIAACIYMFLLIVLSTSVGLAGITLSLIGAYILTLLFLVFLILPLTFGYIYRGTLVVFTGDSEPLLIFKYFTSRKDYLRAFKMSILLTGNALFVGILLFIPAIFADLTSSGKLFTLFGAQIPLWTSSLYPVTYILKTAAVICTVFAMLKYYMAPFLMAANEEMDPVEAIHMSKIISSRSKWNFIGLAFSFIGYILACFLIVPMVFIFPYFNAAYNVHCRFAVTMYNKAVDSMNNPAVPNFNANITF
ncbi:MAG: hypothetical protein J5852_04975 [Clostridia bacterium]|nr:hypothetical protein [Clostridia bacterium]